MEQVKDVHGFWNFTENDLLDGLYSEEWYNEGTEKCLRIYQYTHDFDYLFKTVKCVSLSKLAGATIPPVNGKAWDFLCPTGNAPAGAPCPTSLTGDTHTFILSYFYHFILLYF